MRSVGVVAVAMVCSVHGLDNGVATTPPMGWNSWNHFGCSVSADIMKATADRLVKLGLADAGFRYVNSDDCWLDHNRSISVGEGRLVPGNNFPGGDAGMRTLSNYIHSKGLKFGLYGAAGQTTCANKAGGLYHEHDDAAQMAEWGIDYLKYDDCGEVNIQSYAKFQAMRDGLNATGRPIVFSFEPHNTIPTTWQPYIGNAWRTGHDIGDHYESMFSDLTINNAWTNVGGRGAWNDADMLEASHPPAVCLFR
jgi:alpha-galactosidase